MRKSQNHVDRRHPAVHLHHALAPRALRTLAALALVGAVAPAQTSHDCDVFVTEENPGNVLTYHGITGVPNNTFATVAAANFMAIHTGGPTEHVLVGTRGGGVHEFHRNTGALIKTYNPGGGWQWAGIYAANGDVLIGDMSTNDVRRYNPTNGAFISVFANVPGPADMLFGPNGNLFVCSYLGGGVYELNGVSGAFVALHVPSVGLANDIAFLPDGRRIVTSMADNLAHVFHANWTPATTFAGTGWLRPHGIDISPHDGHIYVVDGVTQAVHKFHPTTYAEVNAAFIVIDSKPVDVEFRRSPRPCGAVISFGPGCGGIDIGHSGLPHLGSNLTLRLSGARPGLPAFLMLGDSNTQWNGLPLPLDLGLIGAPGCSVLISGQVFVPTVTDANGGAAMPLAIPNDGNLVGASVYFQWTVIDSEANALGLLTSGGKQVLVGG